MTLLFSADIVQPAPQRVEETVLQEALAALDPDMMTPREALDALYMLKKTAKK